MLVTVPMDLAAAAFPRVPVTCQPRDAAGENIILYLI